MRSRRAFTLVELMFVLVILGLLMGLLYRIFHSTSQQSHRMDAHYEALRSALTASEVLSRAVESLVTVPVERDEQGKVIPRPGDHQRPVWISEDGRSASFYIPAGDLDPGASEQLADPFNLTLVPASTPGSFYLRRSRGEVDAAMVTPPAHASGPPGETRIYKGVLLRHLHFRLLTPSAEDPALRSPDDGDYLEAVVVGTDRHGEQEEALTVLKPLPFPSARRQELGVAAARYQASAPLAEPTGASNPTAAESSVAEALERLAEAFEAGDLTGPELVEQARAALEPMVGEIPTGALVASGPQVPALPEGARVLTPPGGGPVVIGGPDGLDPAVILGAGGALDGLSGILDRSGEAIFPRAGPVTSVGPRADPGSAP